MTLIGLRESVEFLEADRESRTIKQVIIRAGASKNKRNYPETVLQQAVSLFEGVKTYADHPSKHDMRNRPERSISDITGWLSDVTFDESKKAIVGTRHFTANAKGQDAWALAEMVAFENAPASLFGASINALGRGTKNNDGILEVAEITQAVSVDDVTSPAAGGGFEKLIASDGGIVEAILSEATFEEWFDSRPDYMKRVQNEMKSVRQTEAVKAASAEADQLRETVDSLQDDLTQAQQTHEATLAELAEVRRELQIEKMMRQAHLPDVVEKPLRERLIKADKTQWLGIINEEKLRAKYGASKVTVTGAGRRVAKPLAIPTGQQVGVMNWMEVDTPEKQRAFMQQLARKGN